VRPEWSARTGLATLPQRTQEKRTTVTLQVKPGTTWDEVYARARAAAPEAFDADRILNLHGGEWRRSGEPGDHVTPVDGTPLQGPPRISHDDAVEAVRHAGIEHDAWARSTSTSASDASPPPSPRCASTATPSRCCWSGRSASRGSSRATTSTGR
jgi:hypothetical protein